MFSCSLVSVEKAAGEVTSLSIDSYSSVALFFFIDTSLYLSSVGILKTYSHSGSHTDIRGVTYSRSFFKFSHLIFVKCSLNKTRKKSLVLYKMGCLC